jgi:beta-aspartyl-peptidase (threonine type)
MNEANDRPGRWAIVVDGGAKPINPDGPEAAIARARSQMSRVGGDAGGIAIDKTGRIGWWHDRSDFAVALVAEDFAAPKMFLNKREDAEAHG